MFPLYRFPRHAGQQTLKRRFPAIVIPNSNRLRHIVNKDLPVPDPACARRARQRPDDFFRPFASDTTSSIFTFGSRSTLYSWPR